jgi:hypothetical protein
MRLLKRAAVVALVLGVAAFVAFLYFVPPLLSMAPEAFSGPQNDAAPAVNDIADPAERLIAERGRYLVVTGGCIGCHHVPTPQGPDFSRYLAGGLKFQTRQGTYVSRNLTPDPATGLGRRSDAEVKRVLKSGVFPDGHVVSHRVMPWGGYTAWKIFMPSSSTFATSILSCTPFRIPRPPRACRNPVPSRRPMAAATTARPAKQARPCCRAL